MTSTDHQLTAPRTPGAVVAVRALIGIQAVVAAVGLSMLYFLAILAFAWVGDDTELWPAVAGLFALTAVLAAYGIALVKGAFALSRGAEKVRRRLVGLESVLLGGVVVLANPVGERFGFGALPMPAVVLGVTAAAGLVALLHPSTRAWCSNPASSGL